MLLIFLLPVLVFSWAFSWTLFNVKPTVKALEQEVETVLDEETEDDETEKEYDDEEDDD